MITNQQAFPQILMTDIESLPIIKISLLEQENFIQKTTEILKIKKHNSLSETTALESEIDQLVYKLYGLTEDEIKIVEGK